MIKALTQEDIKITNIYTPNIRAKQYIRQMLTTIKGGTDSSTIIVGTLSLHSYKWVDH